MDEVGVKMVKVLRKNYIFVILLFVSILYCISWFASYEGEIIYSDGALYYQYFSRMFITNDFVNSPLIKYPLGTTLLQLLFLLVGLLVGKIAGMDLQGGLAPVFQGSVFVAAACYAFFAIILIYAMLKKKYGEKVAVITCACMIWGTMFLEYATQKASFSHAYGFFMCTLFVYFVDWYESVYTDDCSIKKKWCMDLTLGILLGIIVLVRNTNVIIGFVYLFYQVSSKKGFVERLKKLFSKKIFVQILGCAAIYAMQVLAWKLQTGRWILYSYGDESFAYLTNPKVLEVLFSDVKGLFIYSPVLILSILGMIVNRKENKEYGIAQWVIFILQTYIISAWWCWWLGCCYGERMYCDFLVIFAIPFANFISALERFRYEICDDEVRNDEMQNDKRRNDEIHNDEMRNDEMHNDVGRQDIRKILYAIIYTIVILFVIFNFMWMNGCHNGIISENMGTWNALHEQLKRFLLK